MKYTAVFSLVLGVAFMVGCYPTPEERVYLREERKMERQRQELRQRLEEYQGETDGIRQRALESTLSLTREMLAYSTSMAFVSAFSFDPGQGCEKEGHKKVLVSQKVDVGQGVTQQLVVVATPTAAVGNTTFRKSVVADLIVVERDAQDSVVRSYRAAYLGTLPDVISGLPGAIEIGDYQLKSRVTYQEISFSFERPANGARIFPLGPAIFDHDLELKSQNLSQVLPYIEPICQRAVQFGAFASVSNFQLGQFHAGAVTMGLGELMGAFRAANRLEFYAYQFRIDAENRFVLTMWRSQGHSRRNGPNRPEGVVYEVRGRYHIYGSVLAFEDLGEVRLSEGRYQFSIQPSGFVVFDRTNSGTWRRLTGIGMSVPIYSTVIENTGE